jgi:hypothetical protein
LKTLKPNLRIKKAKEKPKIKGEKHSFRDLTPPQFLFQGTITSSRPHEVGRHDPLLDRIRVLEEENVKLKKELTRLISIDEDDLK